MGDGGTRGYWQSFRNEYHSIIEGMSYSSRVLESDFAKSFCVEFGENIEDAKYYDGAPFNSFSYSWRHYVGYYSGSIDAEEIITSLDKTDGVITEPLILVTHSMGGHYGRGFLNAIIAYVKKHPEECRGLSISVYDFDPYQAQYMKDVYGVTITQIVHYGTIADQKSQIPDENIIDDTKNSNKHAISSFVNSFKKLESGKYVWNGSDFVKVNEKKKDEKRK